MRTLIILSLFGVLFLTGCGGTIQTGVLNSAGAKVGDITFHSDNQSTILDASGNAIGEVIGTNILGPGGQKLGSIEDRDGHIVIINANNQDVGSLENGTDCYGKTQEKLGTVSTAIDPEAAAAACYLLLLPKE